MVEDDDRAAEAMLNEGGPDPQAPRRVHCVICTQTVPPHGELDPLVICGACGHLLVVAEDGTTRRAIGTDVDRLTLDAQQQLRGALAGFRTLRRQG